MNAQTYKPSRNQHAVRTILRNGGEREFRAAQRERENLRRRIRRALDQELARRERAYHQARRERPEERARDLERKRRWRAANRQHVNAYHRRYDQLTPGRREYKAMKAREYRALAKAAR